MLKTNKKVLENKIKKAWSRHLKAKRESSFEQLKTYKEWKKLNDLYFRLYGKRYRYYLKIDR